MTSTNPNFRDPLAVCEDRQQADRLALNVYGPAAKSLGWTVTVRPYAGEYAIFLVDNKAATT